MAVTTIQNLPQAVLGLVPELQKLKFREEGLATCDSCVLLPENSGDDPDRPWSFHPDSRCCTFHPHLPNYLVGSALQRDDQGSERIRIRMRNRSGVSAWGIRPDQQHVNLRSQALNQFGKNPELRCPYWVGGQHTCGIWADRNAVCRTWFCRFETGEHGQTQWNALKAVLSWTERRLARYCMDREKPPNEAASTTEWIDYFIRCAKAIETLTGRRLDKLGDAELRRLRSQLKQTWQTPPPPLPDRVVARPTESFSEPDGVTFAGYSKFDVVRVGVGAVDLFARLDQGLTWRHALNAHQKECENPLREVDIINLFRVRVLQSPGSERQSAMLKSSEDLPDVLIPAVQPPVIAGGQVLLKAEGDAGSVLAPMAVFAFLAKLDGRTTWREALRLAQEETDEAALHEDLVGDLTRIGALRPPRSGEVG